eukprot:scaffold2051_cov139-Skeletonema_marinoi.AAC.10
MANSLTRRKQASSNSNSSNQRGDGNDSRRRTANANATDGRKKREWHADVANNFTRPLLAVKLPKQEGGVRTRSQVKADLREREHMLMTESIEGKAVLAVQEIIALAKANSADTITQDDMVFFTENMLRLQQEYVLKGINGHIDVGYHYTSSEHIANIRQHGLLTRRDRNDQQLNATFHGSVFGDGIYTANNPDNFSAYGNTGVLVARLPGKMIRVRGSLPSNTMVDANTIVGDKMKDITSQQVDTDNWPLNGDNHEIVMRSSAQCVPMIKYDARSRKTKKGKECINNMEKGLQDIFDKYFNAGLQRSEYQDAEILLSNWVPRVIALASAALPTRTRPPVTIQRLRNSSIAPFSTAGNNPLATRTTGPPRLNSTLSTSAAANASSLRRTSQRIGSGGTNAASATAGNAIAGNAMPSSSNTLNNMATHTARTPPVTAVFEFAFIIVQFAFNMSWRLLATVLPPLLWLVVVIALYALELSADLTKTTTPTASSNPLPGNTHVTRTAIPSTTNTLSYKAPATLTTGIPSDAMSTPDSSCDMEEDCVICQDVLHKRRKCAKLKCGHIFHKECIQRAFQSKPQCPVCRKSIGAPIGKCPSGTMTTTTSSMRCSGFREGSIVITYVIPAGRQMSYHDNPGTNHASKHTTAYIPDNPDGQALLKRLKYAFLHGLTFTVGTSLTTGKQNQCTWASIHHKTSHSRGVQAHGFPDPDYFNNCNAELDGLGVPPVHSLEENGKEV